ncbi:MAG: hypothetical protein ABUL73_04575 [Alphaproteobacteria bacterium]
MAAKRILFRTISDAKAKEIAGNTLAAGGLPPQEGEMASNRSGGGSSALLTAALGFAGGVVVLGIVLVLLLKPSFVQADRTDVTIDFQVNLGETIAAILGGGAALIGAIAFARRGNNPSPTQTPSTPVNPTEGGGR